MSTQHPDAATETPAQLDALLPALFGGGTDPETYARAKTENRLGDIPTNHNPHFAPVLHPTLETGVETLVVAAKAWLSA